MTRALQVYKGGRWCTVAKLTHFTGTSDPILAVCWRKQKGTRRAISLPPAVLDYAERHGASSFYLRDDRRSRMYTCALSLFRTAGWWGRDGELYLRLSDLQPVPWREWEYAEQGIQLEHTLPLFAG